MKKSTLAALLAVQASLSGFAVETSVGGASFPVSIQVDAAKTVGEFKPIWRFFGADEPNYATMPDGKKLLGELGELRPKQVYFRAHNMLCTGDGTPALKWGSTNIYTEDADGNPIYDFTIVDEIFDTYIARGVRPFVQLGFMPEAMSTHPQPYQHSWHPGAKYEEIMTGWSYPPKDYAKWGELAYQWAKHCVERYGAAEVAQWYWEVWNEPNGHYWRDTPEAFRKLHDYGIAGVRRALPTARVGGSHVAGSGGKYQRDFIEHCLRGTNFATGETGTPLDFVAFHAKGSPKFVDGRVQMGIANQLQVINNGFAIVASYPETKDKPIIIGESDPEGCAACQGPQMGYRNGTLYSSYTAASFARKYQLMDRHGVNLEGALTWAFQFEDQPWFAGFRQLATNGVNLPVLNVFRMYSKMSGQRLAVTSTAEVPLDAIMKDGVRGAPDVAALAAGDPAAKRLAVMVWHYHDDDIAGPDAEVEISLAGLPEAARAARVTRYLIDQTHSNSYTVWKAMGSPQAPTDEQYKVLEQAGLMATVDAPVLSADGTTMKMTLARQAVSLLVLEW
jgi:xylan 1,4-beta-xylosidase